MHRRAGFAAEEQNDLSILAISAMRSPTLYSSVVDLGHGSDVNSAALWETVTMADRNDFTPEEWTKVLESIVAAGLAVSAADPSGWWGTLKEAAASTPALTEAKRGPKPNELVRAAIADFERSDDGSILAMRVRFAQADPTECVQRSLTSLREVSAIVDAKAPDEAAAFKAWLRGISQKVAEAAVEGSFLGFGGVRISDAERAILHDISEALGVES